MSQDASRNIIVTGQIRVVRRSSCPCGKRDQQPVHPSQPELNWNWWNRWRARILQPARIPAPPLPISPRRAPARTVRPDFCEVGGSRFGVASLRRLGQILAAVMSQPGTGMPDQLNLRAPVLHILRQQLRSFGGPAVTVPHRAGVTVASRQTPAGGTETPAACGEPALFCAEHTRKRL